MHTFDVAMTGQDHRLVRYCDDFVILCRSEGDARRALHQAQAVLGERHLRLNSEKTRIVSPLEPFDFLGHRFSPDGRVIPPPSLPEVVAKRMVEFASRYRGRTSSRIKSATAEARGMLARLKDAVRRR